MMLKEMVKEDGKRVIESVSESVGEPVRRLANELLCGVAERAMSLRAHYRMCARARSMARRRKELVAFVICLLETLRS